MHPVVKRKFIGIVYGPRRNLGVFITDIFKCAYIISIVVFSIAAGVSLLLDLEWDEIVHKGAYAVAA